MPKRDEMSSFPENMRDINLSIYLKALEKRVSKLEQGTKSTLKVLIEVRNLMKTIEKGKPKK